MEYKYILQFSKVKNENHSFLNEKAKHLYLYSFA